MNSVAIHQLNIKYPAEIMSLLANEAGYHILAFSDVNIKTRFSHKLYHVLYKGELHLINLNILIECCNKTKYVL